MALRKKISGTCYACYFNLPPLALDYSVLLEEKKRASPKFCVFGHKLRSWFLLEKEAHRLNWNEKKLFVQSWIQQGYQPCLFVLSIGSSRQGAEGKIITDLTKGKLPACHGWWVSAVGKLRGKWGRGRIQWWFRGWLKVGSFLGQLLETVGFLGTGYLRIR